VKCASPWLNPLRCSSKLNGAGSFSASIVQGKLKPPFLGSELLFNIDFTLTLIGRLLKAMQADKRSFVTVKGYFNGCQDSKVWEKYDYRDYGIIADPSFDIDYDEVLYITDTGKERGHILNIKYSEKI
jgi:hypothetical protein